MIRNYCRFTGFIIALLLLSGCACKQSALNIYTAKQSVIAFHDDGSYEREMAETVKQAKAYIDQRTKSGDSKLAIVFDVDETLLSNYGYLHKQTDFGHIPDLWDRWVSAADAPALLHVRDMFNYAREKNVTPFIITGRSEEQREATVKNLEKAGYGKFKKLYMKNRQSPVCAAEYKSQIRRQISESGYQIIVNIGDQLSDLSGGYSEKIFKLPNRMYFIK